MLNPHGCIDLTFTVTGAEETQDGYKKIPNYPTLPDQDLYPRRDCGWAASD